MTFQIVLSLACKTLEKGFEDNTLKDQSGLQLYIMALKLLKNYDKAITTLSTYSGVCIMCL